MRKIAFILASLLLGPFSACAQEGPKAVDLGLSVQWAAEDLGPEADIPKGWRLPTLSEIQELQEGCTQSTEERDGSEWVVFAASNGNTLSFFYPMGSRSAREFGIVGSDGCYLKVTILNPLLKTPGRDGYYTWEELGGFPVQRKYPVRLVRE